MFIEGLGTASVVNGVLRIEAYYRNAKGEDVLSGELVIPGDRIIPVAEALNSLITKIRERTASDGTLQAETAE